MICKVHVYNANHYKRQKHIICFAEFLLFLSVQKGNSSQIGNGKQSVKEIGKGIF